MTCCSTFTTGFEKVCHFSMYRQYNVARPVSNACIGMCSNVVEELVTRINHCLCAIALACYAECSKKCWVNCLCIVQEGTNDVLDGFDLLGGEGLCGGLCGV